jgi:hypothetical protein
MGETVSAVSPFFYAITGKNMTIAQINQAIATLQNWQSETFGPQWYESETKMPNYCSDLNAMLAVEKSLKHYDQFIYVDYLYTITKGYLIFHVVNATAHQRAEAYLKTKLKWVEP